LAVLAIVGNAQAQTTERVSVSTSGVPADGICYSGGISENGRFALFYGWATTLVPGDTNGAQDVFVRDRDTKVTTRVSVSSGGVQGNGHSRLAEMTPDGRFVVFNSDATNLVPGDTNGKWDIFLRDRYFGVTTRISIDSSGLQSNGDSYKPAISADGNCTAFQSDATNLVAGDTNGVPDVFVYDRTAGTCERISLATGGVQANGGGAHSPSLSADGRFVAFDSDMNTLVPLDTNGFSDVFLFDRQLQTCERLSVSTAGDQGNGSSYSPVITPDGRYVAFQSTASNLVADDPGTKTDIFLRDRWLGVTTLVSRSTTGAVGNGASQAPSLADDARYVAFESYASDFVAGDANAHQKDGFVRDRSTSWIELSSVSTGGLQSAAAAGLESYISAGGRFVEFAAADGQLVEGDDNGVQDVFVRDRGAGIVTIYCTAQTNSSGCVPAMSAAGTPSTSSPAPFSLHASQVLNQKNGMLFYGYVAGAKPFAGGTRCVLAPLRRTPIQNSRGNPAPADCSGSFTYDMNARIQAGVDPALAAGAEVYAQYWSRDPAGIGGTNLTDAVSFHVEP